VRIVSYSKATDSKIFFSESAESAVASIQNGRWQTEIDSLRSAVDDANRAFVKRSLPAILWTGKFSVRNNTGCEQFSGLICADIDKVQDRVGELHDLARTDSHAFAAFVSPSGTGIKIVFAVPMAKDKETHAQNFAAMRAHVGSYYKAQVDEAAKDIARLCFVSSDPTAFCNPDAIPLPPVKPEVKPLAPALRPALNHHSSDRFTSPQAIAESILGLIDWTDGVTGFCSCPGQHLHTNPNGSKDCQVKVDGSPTIFCVHHSCAPTIDAFNTSLRSKIGKMQFAQNNIVSAYKGAAAEYLVAQEVEVMPKSNLPPMVDAAEFLETEIKAPPELISGLLHRGSKLVFGGSSKSYKTWNMLDLALSVASGNNWLGRETTRGRVLFLNFEIQDFAWQKRINFVAKAKGLKLERGDAVLWNLRGYAASFRQIIPQIADRCKMEDFSLIVLDPIYKLYGGADENAAGDMGELLNSVERLAAQSGAAIAFGAHFAKGNASAKEAIDRISGSGVFARDPDSLLMLTKHEEDEAFVVEPILRNFAPVLPFTVRWNFPLMELAEDLDPMKLKQAAGRKSTHSADDVLDLVEEGGIDYGIWEKKAAKKGIPKTTFFRLVSAAKTAKKVLKSEVDGKWHVLNPKKDE
jgi:AAA domain/VirE N-terminal domain